MKAPVIAAVIPARYASTRFPGKPLALIAGRPMIEWVYERAARVRGFATVLVATDDERIRACVEGFGGRAVMTDPALPSGTDRMRAALKGVRYDWALNIQGDEPLVKPALLKRLAARAAADRTPRIITAAERITDLRVFADPNCVKVVCGRQGRALYFSRSPIPHTGRADPRHTAPLLKHIGIYLFHREALRRFTSAAPSRLERTEKLEQLRAFDLCIPIEVVTTAYHPVNVDVPADIRAVEKQLRRKGRG